MKILVVVGFMIVLAVTEWGAYMVGRKYEYEHPTWSWAAVKNHDESLTEVSFRCDNEYVRVSP